MTGHSRISPWKTGVLFIFLCQSPSKKRSAVQLGLFRPFFLRCENAPGNPISTPVFAISSPAWGKPPPFVQGSPSEKGICPVVCLPSLITPPKTGLLFNSMCQSPSVKRSAVQTLLKGDILLRRETTVKTSKSCRFLVERCRIRAGCPGSCLASSVGECSLPDRTSPDHDHPRAQTGNPGPVASGSNSPGSLPNL